MKTSQKIFILLILFSCLVSPALAQDTNSVLRQDPSTSYIISLNQEGDATWNIKIKFRLSENQTEEFQNFQAEELPIFHKLENNLNNLTERLNERKKRDIYLHNFERNIYTERTETGNIGIAELRFEWENFAKINDSTLTVGDIFPGGFSLGENEELIIKHDLSLSNVSPNPNYSADGEIRWKGPYFFNKTPKIRFSTTGKGTTIPIGDLMIPGFIILIAIISFAGGVYISKRLNRKKTEKEGLKEKFKQGSTENELVTDEDRVTQLLKENGGKMKQSDIVRETNWSKSKVSNLLSGMEEDKKIEKLRLGRENVIELKNEGREK